MFTIKPTENNSNEYTQLVKKEERNTYIMDQHRRRKNAVVELDWEPPRAPHVEPQVRRLDLGGMPSYEDDVFEDTLVKQLEVVSTNVRFDRVRSKKKKQSSLPKPAPLIPPIEGEQQVLIS